MSDRRGVSLLGTVLAFLVIVALSAWFRDLRAYNVYSDTSQTDGMGNCASCHELPVGGFFSRGILHGAHEAKATGTCRLCHTSTGDVPRLGSSGVTGGLGCIGCHGQPLITGGSSGAGLRRHHALANVPADIGGRKCINCHASDPLPPPESTPPAYYARTDVIQKSPCNTDGKEDFWNRATGAADGRGLDNDGDLLYDAISDPDCGASACRDRDQDGYGDPGDASCRLGSARDCDDGDPTVFPGAIEAYDLKDSNCNGQVDEIEGVGFGDPINRQRLTWRDQPPAGQLYDVIRSDSPLFPVGSSYSICLVLASPLAYADDTVPVPPGRAFYYLVRNTRVGDYGLRSDGTPRLYAICP